MTCYLTDNLNAEELIAGQRENIFTAAKLYPAGATFNSDHGVSDVKKIYPLLETLQSIGMPLLVHGEVVDTSIDIFDREALFIDQVLIPMRREFPELSIVFEHITTDDAVQYVESQGNKQQAIGLAATITPHHLVLNRNAMFTGGIRADAYCLPVVKRESHRLALRRAATSGDARFFLGTDSAPHLSRVKYAECGCAGIFNAPTAMQYYAQVFDQENALSNLEAFASLNGPAYYGLPTNRDSITLQRSTPTPFEQMKLADDHVRVFTPTTLNWAINPAGPQSA
jgi:dihydroorotase